MKSLIVTNSKNACERLLLYKFFDNLDDSNTHPDEIDAEHLSWIPATLLKRVSSTGVLGNFGKFQEQQFRKTPASVYFCIRFFNDLDEIATYPDGEDRELHDNKFSCSDDNSETEYY